MGKGARNREIRKAALRLKQDHPSFHESPKTIARKVRRKHGRVA